MKTLQALARWIANITQPALVPLVIPPDPTIYDTVDELTKMPTDLAKQVSMCEVQLEKAGKDSQRLEQSLKREKQKTEDLTCSIIVLETSQQVTKKRLAELTDAQNLHENELRQMQKKLDRALQDKFRAEHIARACKDEMKQDKKTIKDLTAIKCSQTTEIQRLRQQKMQKFPEIIPENSISEITTTFDSAPQTQTRETEMFSMIGDARQRLEQLLEADRKARDLNLALEKGWRSWSDPTIKLEPFPAAAKFEAGAIDAANPFEAHLTMIEKIVNNGIVRRLKHTMHSATGLAIPEANCTDLEALEKEREKLKKTPPPTSAWVQQFMAGCDVGLEDEAAKGMKKSIRADGLKTDLRFQFAKAKLPKQVKLPAVEAGTS